MPLTLSTAKVQTTQFMASRLIAGRWEGSGTCLPPTPRTYSRSCWQRTHTHGAPAQVSLSCKEIHPTAENDAFPQRAGYSLSEASQEIHFNAVSVRQMLLLVSCFKWLSDKFCLGERRVKQALASSHLSLGRYSKPRCEFLPEGF